MGGGDHGHGHAPTGPFSSLKNPAPFDQKLSPLLWGQYWPAQHNRVRELQNAFWKNGALPSYRSGGKDGRYNFVFTLAYIASLVIVIEGATNVFADKKKVKEPLGAPHH